MQDCIKTLVFLAISAISALFFWELSSADWRPLAVLLIGSLIGLIPASIARHKGHSFAVWWALGTFLFVIALPITLLLSPDLPRIEQRRLSEGMKKCPFCAELIKEEAAVCKHCGRDLITHAESAEVRSPTRRKATERARYV